ncbi:MAG: hypothetical protein M1114_03055 [Candidatus Dependentiae bacterium]|nr:hypothetical protein [Candidatus Dependentiae bacterium]
MKKIIIVTNALSTLVGICFGMDTFQQGYHHFTLTHSQITHIKVFTPRIVYPLPSVPGLSHQVEKEKSPLETLATIAQQAEPVITLPTPSSTATGTLQPDAAQPSIDKTIAKQLAHLHQSSTKQITVGMKAVSRQRFRCGTCNFATDAVNDFMKHESSYIHKSMAGKVAESTFNKYEFKCYDCLVGFDKKDKLDSHRLSKDHRERVGLPTLKWNEKKYRCNMCRKGFHKEKSLPRHLSLSETHKEKRRQTVIKIK